MKKKIWRLINCVITICLTIGILSMLTNLMERKASDEKYADFWNQTADFDILFMGSSHVINAVFPMELWNDYGISSYNFGGHSNRLATTYWVMENALEKTTPRVMVIDCWSVSEMWKSSNNFSYLHLSLDTFPMSSTKLMAIWDLLDDPALEDDIANGNAKEGDESRTKLGLLWDYSVYHSRWEEINKEDFEPELTYEKGAESRINVVRAPFKKIPPDEKMSPGTTGEQYLRKMIEDCQQRGIKVLLTYLPFCASENCQKEANYIYDIAEEYNVDYINFLDMDLINFQTDLFDADSHLNPSGARKVTRYLGEYLTSNFEVPDRHDDADYDNWYKDYDEYIDIKNKTLTERMNLMEYLMLLSGDDVEIRMDVQNKDIFKNQWIMDLLANIGIDTSQLTEDTDDIIISDKGSDVTVVNGLREDGASRQTKLGEMKIVYDMDGHNHDSQTGYYDIFLNGEQFLTGNSENGTGMQIDVYRKGKRIDSVKFVYTVDAETKEVNVSAVNR